MKDTVQTVSFPGGLNNVPTLQQVTNTGATTSGDVTVGSLTASNGTISTVPYLDASKKLVSSAATPTELGYLSGVTSAIQTQITARQLGRTQVRVVPSTGDTVTIANQAGDISYIIDPAGTLVALTVNMPSSPVAGQKVTICSSQIITGITMAVGMILGALTTLAAVNGFAAREWNATASKRFRTG